MYFPKKFLIITLIINVTSYQSVLAREMTIDGHFSAGNEMDLNVKIFKGKGVLDAKNINITCDDFRFTGTICCSGTCKIKAKNDFDYNQFTREGEGKFTIIIEPDGYERHSESSLLVRSNRLLFRDPGITEQKIYENLVWLHSQAVENQLDESIIKQNIQKKINKMMAGEAIDCDMSAEKADSKRYGLLFGASSLASMVTAATLFKIFGFNSTIPSRIACVIAAASLLSGFISVRSFLNLYDSIKQEENAKKAAQLPKEVWLFMQTKLYEVFAQPYTPKRKIIKL